MKIRYFCVTLLFCGLFIYGAAALLEKVAQRTYTPASGLPAPAISDHITGQPAATHTTPPSADTQKPENTARPAVKDTVVPPAQAAAFTLSPEKIKEVQGRYKNAVPSQWGEHTRGVVHKVNLPATGAPARTLFLTINAYNNHQEELTGYLAANNVKATIFVSGYYAQYNVQALQRLSQNPLFDIGNLGNRCKPVSVAGDSAYHITGTANIYGALQEVTEGAKKIQQATGKYPTCFRSATGYIDDVAAKAINELGIQVIGYDQVTDEGGAISAAAIKERILHAAHGTIIVISINRNYPNILKGLQNAIEDIKTNNLPVRFEKLSDYRPFFEVNR
ncbi:MAG: polysaccharide deacetylase family protein [Prevotellaceae bacterium]|jgi:peptidoglycan/xylan/chitin deacetylase (PgdA/CDA1 family)|nr:polysaccharide deacetylase family protein [Prevotellaceae bacterium]